MQLTADLEQYLLESQEELRKLIHTLCAIPAPSHHEEARAEFCLHWFQENGGTNAFIDAALNVICPCGVSEDGPIAVLMAHTDTVFQDTSPMPQREENGMLWCPGVCDDTANLAVLMICARWVLRQKQRSKVGLVFVANSCEEGLGNLKGCRAVCDRYGDRMQEFITLDGFTLNELVRLPPLPGDGPHRGRPLFLRLWQPECHPCALLHDRHSLHGQDSSGWRQYHHL